MKQYNYIVIQDSNLSFLTKEVNKYLSKGYICLGNVSVRLNNDITTFYQSLVCQKKKK